MTSVTTGLPSVNVPVLSKAIVSIFANFSTYMPPLNKTPFLAPDVMLDTIEIGVERAKVLARALQCHPAVLVFPGWDIQHESAA